jgi:membrane-bound lytic murein transglycosylase D
LLYTARRGDTLVSIADRFGVSLDQLRRWNKIPAGIKVEPGRRLHVAEPSSAQRSSGRSRRGSSKKASEAAEKPASRASANPAPRKNGHTTREKAYADKQK